MKRRLLLINPADIVDGKQRPGPAQSPIPPLNLGYVAALTPSNWEIRVIDENLRMEDGADWAPDVVGITTLTPTAPRACVLAKRYRRAGAHVVLGGIHASTLPDEAAQYADTVVIGEAEPVWRQLIADSEARHPQARYRGRARNTWRHTRDPLATLIASGWNWRSFRALRTFPLRDVRGTRYTSTASQTLPSQRRAEAPSESLL
jgi:hypothetical protein